MTGMTPLEISISTALNKVPKHKESVGHGMESSKAKERIINKMALVSPGTETSV